MDLELSQRALQTLGKGRAAVWLMFFFDSVGFVSFFVFLFVASYSENLQLLVARTSQLVMTCPKVSRLDISIRLRVIALLHLAGLRSRSVAKRGRG